MRKCISRYVRRGEGAESAWKASLYSFKQHQMSSNDHFGVSTKNLKSLCEHRTQKGSLRIKLRIIVFLLIFGIPCVFSSVYYVKKNRQQLEIDWLSVRANQCEVLSIRKR